jgi:5-methylcytosine-specific restriction endonuclease McrA
MGHPRIEEVIEALSYLGGEANWPDIEAYVTRKRGGSWKPYQDRLTFRTTMFQFVQQHCEGYSKFIGPVFFSKVQRRRFRLVTPSTRGARRTPQAPDKIHPETVPADREYITGAVRKVLVNAYERDPDARRACLKQHGTRCAVCAISFEQRYGPIGIGFIHVHHKKPLATREVYQLNPVSDLVPVCPNCHSMLHKYEPPLSIEELREEMRRAALGSLR